MPKSVKKNGTKKTNRGLSKNIVFVDNNQKLWKDDMSRFSDSMHYLRIKSDNVNAESGEESTYTMKMAMEGNRYASAIMAVIGPNMKSYSPNDGIDADVAKKLKTWASKVKGEKYALIDWDRTISCIEGIVPQAFQMGGSDKEFLDDAFVYLMRRDRIPHLKSLFRYLKASGVNIHILTHNPYASVDSPYRPIFIEMMWRLFNDEDAQQKEYNYVENGVRVHVFQESSRALFTVGREELEGMLHSTVDYTLPGKVLHKSNMVCHIIPNIKKCPRRKQNATRRVFLIRAI